MSHGFNCTHRGANDSQCLVCYAVGAECYPLDLKKCVDVLSTYAGVKS